jgi:predicted permease
VSLYSALLWLYPASFRAEYAGEMQAIFRQRLRAAKGRALLQLWIDTVLEHVGNALGAHWDILRQDLAYAVRSLIHAPGFAFTAIAVIALGIGANTAVFSVADFVFLRPLPYAGAERLVKLWEEPDGGGMNEVSAPLYREWSTQLESYEAMGAYYRNSVNLVGEGSPQRLEMAAVTASLLPILGVPPMRGHLFDRGEDDAVIVSYGLWQSSLGGDEGVLGKRVLIDGNPHVVVGVMPRDFHYPNRQIALWTLIGAKQLDDPDLTNTYWEVLARLRPGVSLKQADTETRELTRRIRRSHPQEMEDVGAVVLGLRDEFSQRPRLMLAALCGAAACVLLIACANLANLLLARALTRRRELLVRAALGAGRERLVRQSITESLLLALIGGAIGIAIAAIAVPLLARLVPETLPIAQAPSIDPRIIGFAAVLTFVTGLGFGIFPAWQSAQALDLTGMAAGARSGGGRQAHARSTLVVVEIIATVVLLVSAGLLMRALLRLQDVDPGFRAPGVMTLRTALPSPQYDATAARAAFYRQVLSDVRALPGVTSAAYITSLPVAAGGGIWPVVPEGSATPRNGVEYASSRYVTPGYFATMAIPLLRGRDVADTDLQKQGDIAVVSQSFAAHYWPGQDPIGKRFKFQTTVRTVVGVVGDVRMRGPEQPSEPQAYLAYQQADDGSSPFYAPKDLVIRATITPTALVPAVRSIVERIDPQQPVSDIRSMDAVVEEATAARSVQVRVLAIFAALGAFLAAIGIHGLLALSVSSRQHEIGVRLALGAQRADIVRMVMRQGVLLAAAGVVPGIVIAYAVAHAMRSLLAGVDPGDVQTFVAVAALCALITLTGSLLPTLRAVRIDPAAAFRTQT